MKILCREREHLLKQWGGKEMDIYHTKIEGVTGKFGIGIKHFKVMTEADNILETSRCHKLLKLFFPLLLHPKLHLTKTKLITRQLQILSLKI